MTDKYNINLETLEQLQAVETSLLTLSETCSLDRPHSFTKALFINSQEIQVPHPHGSFLKSMGKFTQNIFKLNRFETLYLLERGSIALYIHDHVPVSIQYAYHLLLPLPMDSHLYQVYAYLKNLGYIVVSLTLPSSSSDVLNASSTIYNNFYKKSFCRWPLISCGLYMTFTSALDALPKLKRFLMLTQSDQPYPMLGFNCYKPVPHFKKSNPPEPDLRVLVVSTDQDMFHFTDFYAYQHLFHHLYIAVVDGSSISFISPSVSRISIRTD